MDELAELKKRVAEQEKTLRNLIQRMDREFRKSGLPPLIDDQVVFIDGRSGDRRPAA